MIFGHPLGDFVIPGFTVLLNTAIAVVLSAYASKNAYRRGYYAAQQTNEAIALGRMMEQAHLRRAVGEEIMREKGGGEWLTPTTGISSSTTTASQSSSLDESSSTS